MPDVAPDESGMLLVRQVADYFGVSIGTVHRWLKRGVFPHAVNRGPLRPKWHIPWTDVLAVEHRWTAGRELPP